MEHAKLGALASACQVSRDMLKWLTREGFIPVVGGGHGTGDHRRFDIEGVVTASAISALLQAGIGKLQSARLVQALSEHRHTRHLTLVTTQFLDGEWINGPATEWHALDEIVDIVDGRCIWSARTWNLFGQGEPVLLGRVYGDLHGRGEDIHIREMQGGDPELDRAKVSRLHPRTLLRVNLSFTARWVVRRLLSNSSD